MKKKIQLDGINGTSDIEENKVSKPEDTALESIQN